MYVVIDDYWRQYGAIYINTNELDHPEIIIKIFHDKYPEIFNIITKHNISHSFFINEYYHGCIMIDDEDAPFATLCGLNIKESNLVTYHIKYDNLLFNDRC